MDARNLAFPDDTFDTVVAMHLISVVPEPERWWRRWRGSAAPAARSCCSTTSCTRLAPSPSSAAGSGRSRTSSAGIPTSPWSRCCPARRSNSSSSARARRWHVHAAPAAEVCRGTAGGGRIERLVGQGSRHGGLPARLSIQIARIRQDFRCPSHSNGNPSSRSSSCSSAGCRPSRIASTISGASSVSRRTRLT